MVAVSPPPNKGFAILNPSFKQFWSYHWQSIIVRPWTILTDQWFWWFPELFSSLVSRDYYHPGSKSLLQHQWLVNIQQVLDHCETCVVDNKLNWHQTNQQFGDLDLRSLTFDWPLTWATQSQTIPKNIQFNRWYFNHPQLVGSYIDNFINQSWMVHHYFQFDHFTQTGKHLGFTIMS